MLSYSKDGPQAPPRACASLAVECALVLFAISLGLSLAACVQPVAGSLVSGAFALLFVFLCFGLWYCYPHHRRRQLKAQPRKAHIQSPLKRPEQTPLEIRMRDVLTEARIILPGAQAMLGFQMVAFLTRAFSELPPSSKWSHVAAVLSLLCCIVLLWRLRPSTGLWKGARRRNGCTHFPKEWSSSRPFPSD